MDQGAYVGGGLVEREQVLQPLELLLLLPLGDRDVYGRDAVNVALQRVKAARDQVLRDRLVLCSQA